MLELVLHHQVSTNAYQNLVTYHMTMFKVSQGYFMNNFGKYFI